MTIKKLLSLMFLSYFFCLIILSVIFSENGILYNNSLKAHYAELKRQEELYEIRLEALKKQKERRYEEDYLKDIALSLGYNEEGEKVFYFDEEDVLEEVGSDENNSPKERFEGVESWILALYSLIIPAMLLLYYILRKIFSSSADKEELPYKGGYDDYSF